MNAPGITDDVDQEELGSSEHEIGLRGREWMQHTTNWLNEVESIPKLKARNNPFFAPLDKYPPSTMDTSSQCIGESSTSIPIDRALHPVINFPATPPDTPTTPIPVPLAGGYPHAPWTSMMTPPETPTSPFGQTMKPFHSTATSVSKEVSFMTSYPQTHDSAEGPLPESNASFKAKKPRPQLRVNTELRVSKIQHVNCTPPVSEASLGKRRMFKLEELKRSSFQATEEEEDPHEGIFTLGKMQVPLTYTVVEEEEILIQLETKENDKYLNHKEKDEKKMLTLEEKDEDSPVNREDNIRELKVFSFVGSDLRRIADQFQETYTKVGSFLKNGAISLTFSTAITGCLTASIFCLNLEESSEVLP